MNKTGLSAEEQFLAEIAAIPRLSDAEHYRLMRLACEGDKQARQEFVWSLVPFLIGPARACASWCQHLSLLDIVQHGCETLLSLVDRALWGENPVAYLIGAAKKSMVHACSARKGLVRTPDNALPYLFVSLDTPIYSDDDVTLADLLPAPDGHSEKKAYPALYQALAQLSEDRRELLGRRYGLFGYPATSFTDLAVEVYPDVSVQQACERLNARLSYILFLLQEALTARSQALPDEFYTMTEIRQRYGVTTREAQRWFMIAVRQGRLTRHLAPGEMCSTGVRYVYAKAEVEALVMEWQAAGRVTQEAGTAVSASTPDGFYTPVELYERFGFTRGQLMYWTKMGRITRISAPDGVRSQSVRFLYAKAEIDALVEKRGDTSLGEEFLTLQEIVQRYPVEKSWFDRQAKQGRLKRYAAPPGVDALYVYAKAEVEALLAEKQAAGRQREADSERSILRVTRQAPDAKRQTRKESRQRVAEREEVA